jgi:hypothetical protein
MKTIQISNFYYEMLLEVSKKKRMKPIDLFIQLLEKEYHSK